MALVVGFPTSGFAERADLRMGVVDVSKKQKTKAFRTFYRVVKDAKNVDLVDSDELIEAADALGLTTKVLRSGRLRDQEQETITQWMEDTNLEALILVDVFSKGRKMQALAYGPGGELATDQRRKIRRWKLSKSKAKKLLLELFRELVPAVKDARERAQEREQDEIEIEEEDDGMDFDVEEVDETVSDDEDEDEASRDYEVDVGLFAGSRSLLTTSEAGLEIAHNTPLLGVAAAGRGQLAYWPDLQLGLVADLSLDVAPFATVFEGNFQYASLYLRYAGHLGAQWKLSESLTLGASLGFESLQITIDANPVYTGSRYMSVPFRALASYQSEDLAVGVNAGILPVLSSLDSNGVYGDPGVYVALGAGVRAQYSLTSRFFVAAAYGLRYFGPSYTERNDPVTSSDLIHLATLTGGLSL